MAGSVTDVPGHGASVVLARACAVAGGALLVFPFGAAALAALNAMIWHHDGDIVGMLILSLPYLVVGLVLLVWPLRRHRAGTGDHRPRTPGHPGRAVALVVGLLGVLLAVVIVMQTLLFELTYVEAGNVGASFSLLGIWFADVVVVPFSAVLVGYGFDASPRWGGHPR